jgi:hypothetical protein
VVCDYFWESLNVNFRIAHYVCHVFPLRESRGYRISFVACRAEALAKAGQGFAVGYYSFTRDAVDLQHPRLLQRQGDLFRCQSNGP